MAPTPIGHRPFRAAEAVAGGDRYVLMGLAQARSGWFGAVAQWANAGTLPAEFVKCVSVEELRARLASGRPFSAVLVDAALPALDRDLVELARGAGCAVILISRAGSSPDAAALGASAVLPDFFDPKALVDVLSAQAALIGRAEGIPGEPDGEPSNPRWRGRVAMVCGPGGTGASTVAIALAQALAEDPRHGRSVLLADLALHAEQAMLHDARDVVPGIQELVEAHRSRGLPPREVQKLAFSVEERGYQLLLGLRRARAWSSVRPRAFAAAFDTLRASYRVVVCDADADLEGEDSGGSLDVEERHVMSRTAASAADAVFAVGLPGMKGLHSLVRVLDELRGAGVPPARVVPVLTRTPRSPRARGELSTALAELAGAGDAGAGTGAFGPTLFLPEIKAESLLRDGLPLPSGFAAPLARAWNAVVQQHFEPAGSKAAAPAVRVRPGSLGSWPDPEDDSRAAHG